MTTSAVPCLYSQVPTERRATRHWRALPLFALESWKGGVGFMELLQKGHSIRRGLLSPFLTADILPTSRQPLAVSWALCRTILLQGKFACLFVRSKSFLLTIPWLLLCGMVFQSLRKICFVTTVLICYSFNDTFVLCEEEICSSRILTCLIFPTVFAFSFEGCQENSSVNGVVLSRKDSLPFYPWCH